MKQCFAAFLMSILVWLTGCGKAQTSAASADWDKYIAAYLDAYFAAHPDQAVSAGRHEFDGKLPDFSKAANDRLALGVAQA